MSVSRESEPGTEATLVDEVLLINGVADVYSPYPAIRRIPSLMIPGVPDPGPEVAIERGEDGVGLAVRIATTTERATAETARLVADLLLTSTEGPVVAVSVEVARIH